MSTGKFIGDQRYKIGSPIAKGAFSTVYRCVDLVTATVYAVKVVNKAVIEANSMQDAVVREINAMDVAPPSKHIVNLIEKLSSERNYYLIMDLAEGGSLLELIREFPRGLPVKWARRFFRHLLIGLSTLHLSDVVHRDIKPDNLLLNKDRTILMISDFGFACCAPANRRLHRACGTLRYCAPELLVESPDYDGRKVDVWSAGVTLYFMLFVTYPFQACGSDHEGLVQAILSGAYSMPRLVSPALEHLFSVMLDPEPALRWDAGALLRHPWVLGEDDIAAPALRNLSSAKAIGQPHLLRPGDARRRSRSCPVLPAGRSTDCVSGWSPVTRESCCGTAGRRAAPLQLLSEDADSRSTSLSGSAIAVLYNMRSMSSSLVSSLSDSITSRGSSAARTRDIMLTLRVAVNFVVFCTALVLAVLLRMLFGVDVAHLPVPAFVRDTVEQLLVPPHERPEQRNEVHRMRHRLPGAWLRRIIAAAERAVRFSTWGRRFVQADPTALHWDNRDNRDHRAQGST